MVRLAFRKHSNSIFSLAIKAWTLGPYSHVEFILDDTVFGAVESIGTFNYPGPIIDTACWDYVTVSMSAHDEWHLRNWCLSEMNCGYDWKGLWLSQVIGLRREDPEKWFCSEFCTAGLQQVGLFKGIKPCTVSPNRLGRLMRGSRYSFM